MEKVKTIKGKTWQAKKLNNNYVLNINSGEKIIASLEDFVQSEKIQSGEISGIGAASEATLGFYNFESKDFDKQTFKEQMEIVSALGNIAYKGEELYIHLHLTLGRSDYGVYGGHLLEATIHGVGEFYIRANPFKIIKSNDKGDKNMWVYNFDK